MAGRPKKEQPAKVEEQKPVEAIKPVMVERTEKPTNTQPSRVVPPVIVNKSASHQGNLTVREKKTGRTKEMAAAFAQALVRSDRVNFEIVE